MFEFLNPVRAVTTGIDHHLPGKLARLTLREIARTRLGVQQLLLPLPSSEELKSAAPGPNLYECCHLTAIIFSAVVLFPIPNIYDAFQKPIRQLKVAVKVESIKLRGMDGGGEHFKIPFVDFCKITWRN
jgi:hypothetical protein